VLLKKTIEKFLGKRDKMISTTAERAVEVINEILRKNLAFSFSQLVYLVRPMLKFSVTMGSKTVTQRRTRVKRPKYSLVKAAVIIFIMRTPNIRTPN